MRSYWLTVRVACGALVFEGDSGTVVPHLGLDTVVDESGGMGGAGGLGPGAVLLAELPDTVSVVGDAAACTACAREHARGNVVSDPSHDHFRSEDAAACFEAGVQGAEPGPPRDLPGAPGKAVLLDYLAEYDIKPPTATPLASLKELRSRLEEQIQTGEVRRVPRHRQDPAGPPALAGAVLPNAWVPFATVPEVFAALRTDEGMLQARFSRNNNADRAAARYRGGDVRDVVVADSIDGRCVVVRASVVRSYRGSESVVTVLFIEKVRRAVTVPSPLSPSPTLLPCRPTLPCNAAPHRPFAPALRAARPAPLTYAYPSLLSPLRARRPASCTAAGS